MIIGRIIVSLFATLVELMATIVGLGFAKIALIWWVWVLIFTLYYWGNFLISCFLFPGEIND